MTISQDSYAGRLARILTARDLQWPLGPTLRIEMSVSDANECLLEAAMIGNYDPVSRYSIVVGRDGVAGYVTVEMLHAEKSELGACIEVFPPEHQVPEETPALDLFNRLTIPHVHPFFVVGQHEITGTVAAGEFMGILFRLCFFAVTIELEEAARDLLIRSPKDAWEALGSQRQEAAKSIYEARPSRASGHSSLVLARDLPGPSGRAEAP